MLRMSYSKVSEVKDPKIRTNALIQTEERDVIYHYRREGR